MRNTNSCRPDQFSYIFFFQRNLAFNKTEESTESKIIVMAVIIRVTARLTNPSIGQSSSVVDGLLQTLTNLAKCSKCFVISVASIMSMTFCLTTLYVSFSRPKHYASFALFFDFFDYNVLSVVCYLLRVRTDF